MTITVDKLSRIVASLMRQKKALQELSTNLLPAAPHGAHLAKELELARADLTILRDSYAMLQHEFRMLAATEACAHAGEKIPAYFCRDCGHLVRTPPEPAPAETETMAETGLMFTAGTDILAGALLGRSFNRTLLPVGPSVADAYKQNTLGIIGRARHAFSKGDIIEYSPNGSTIDVICLQSVGKTPTS